MAYCDALPHSLSTILPQILARCPEDIRESDLLTSPDIVVRTLCIAAKGMESRWVTSSDIIFGQDLYSKYAASLLYRSVEVQFESSCILPVITVFSTLGSLPAVVRNWYAGLPNTGMQIVNR